MGFAFRQNGDCAFESSRVRPTTRAAAEAAPLPLISRVRELRLLKDADARRGYPIHLVGVVTCCGPGGALFIDDGSAGTYIESRRHLQTTHPGDRVEVTGVSAGDFVPIVDHPRVRTLGHGPLPPPRAIGPEQLVAGEEDGQWVSVEGIVRSVTERRYFAEIYVSTGGFVRFPVEVPLGEVSAARELIDARVRVRGVRGSRFNSGRQLADVALVTSGLEMLTVLKPPPNSSSIPLLPVKALLQFVPGQHWEHQVRARGTVTYASDGELYIRDETGGLPVRGAPSPAAVGDLVEVVGFAGAGLFAPALEDARLLSRTPGEPVSPRFITPEQAVSGRFDGDLVQIDARMLDTQRQPGGNAAVAAGGTLPVSRRPARTRPAVARTPAGQRVAPDRHLRRLRRTARRSSGLSDPAPDARRRAGATCGSMVDVAPSGVGALGRRERRRAHFRVGAGSEAPSAGTVHHHLEARQAGDGAARATAHGARASRHARADAHRSVALARSGEPQARHLSHDGATAAGTGDRTRGGQHRRGPSRSLGSPRRIARYARPGCVSARDRPAARELPLRFDRRRSRSGGQRSPLRGPGREQPAADRSGGADERREAREAVPDRRAASLRSRDLQHARQRRRAWLRHGLSAAARALWSRRNARARGGDRRPVGALKPRQRGNGSPGDASISATSRSLTLPWSRYASSSSTITR